MGGGSKRKKRKREKARNKGRGIMANVGVGKEGMG
jgi:hypothetical protein